MQENKETILQYKSVASYNCFSNKINLAASVQFQQISFTDYSQYMQINHH